MTITIEEALGGAGRKLRRQSDSPGADAQLLLMEALGKPRAWILAHPERELGNGQLAEFEASLTAVLDGAALPHVLGWWEFYGRRFQLEPQVLIPRPETELMVEVALSSSDRGSRILDIGTGSGCMAVTLALEVPESRIVASDLSWEALKVARRNVLTHSVERRVHLINSNLVDAFAGPFDLICANLPYVPTDQLPHLAVASREPAIALDGGTTGTELIFATLERLPRILAPGGRALFEIDPNQASGVIERSSVSFPSATLRIKKDLAGRERLVMIDRD